MNVVVLYEQIFSYCYKCYVYYIVYIDNYCKETAPFDMEL